MTHEPLARTCIHVLRDQLQTLVIGSLSILLSEVPQPHCFVGYSFDQEALVSHLVADGGNALQSQDFLYVVVGREIALLDVVLGLNFGLWRSFSVLKSGFFVAEESAETSAALRENILRVFVKEPLVELDLDATQ